VNESEVAIARGQDFGCRDKALASETSETGGPIQSAVAASLCRRTPDLS